MTVENDWSGTVDAKDANDRLSQAHEWTKRLLASISSALIGVGKDQTVGQWNPAAEKLFGIPANDVIGRPFLECGVQWDWSRVLESLPENGGGDSGLSANNVSYKRPDGSDGFLDIRISPIRGGNEEVGVQSEFLFLATDVTEQSILQAQLLQAQKLESIGQLAAGVAHEINTPTQYVGDNLRFLNTSFADILECVKVFREMLDKAKEGPVTDEMLATCREEMENADIEYLSEEIPKALKQSIEGTDRVSEIVLAMKEFSHPSTKEITPFNLNEAIGSTVTVARNEWKYVSDLELDLDPDLPLVPCLPGEFNQVVLNLVVNAAHAIGEKLGESPVEKGKIVVSTKLEEGYAVVSISDTGAGIPEEIRDRILDPFFTTKKVGKGTGQGLAIARSVVVDKLSGELTFDSEVGKGTTFHIRLPLENPDGDDGEGGDNEHSSSEAPETADALSTA